MRRNKSPKDARQSFFDRSAAVKIYVLERAKGRCEVCGHVRRFSERMVRTAQPAYSFPGNAAVCYRPRRSRVHQGNVWKGYFAEHPVARVLRAAKSCLKEGLLWL
jgi:hypothetical protein